MPAINDFQQWNNEITRSERESCLSDDNYEFWHIVTRVGYVVAFTLVFPKTDRFKGSEYTRLMFAWDGSIYNRVWQKKWKPKTITRLANNMVADITNEIAVS